MVRCWRGYLERGANDLHVVNGSGETLRPGLNQLCKNAMGHLTTNGIYPALQVCGLYRCADYTGKKVKVKASHTRYRALGPELIPVYRQSARR